MSTGTVTAVTARALVRSSRRRMLRTGSHLLVIFSCVWVLAFLFAAISADILPIASPDVDAGIGVRLPPFQNWPEFLGTDSLGRSTLSRVILGSRTSLAIGVLAVLVGMVVGGLLGLLAGYKRAWIDNLIGTFTDAMLAFPALIFLMALAAVLGRGVGMVIIGLGAVAIPSFLRVARANAIRFSTREFVHAARLSGASVGRILMREILPNIVPPMMAYAVIVMAGLIVAESSLSFLGLGVAPPTPSWGGMIADGRYELRAAPALVFVPAAVLFFTVLSFNVLGDAARRRLDVSNSRL